MIYRLEVWLVRAAAFSLAATSLTGPALAETNPEAKAKTQPAPRSPSAPDIAPEPETLHRVSRLLEAQKLLVTYELCGADSKNPAIRATADLVNRARDALDALEAMPNATDPRVPTVAERLASGIPKPERTLDATAAHQIANAAKELKALPDPSNTKQPPQQRIASTNPRIQVHEGVLALETKLREAFAKQPGCDEGCRDYAEQNCGRAEAPPLEERVPATGGLAWTVRPVRDLNNDVTHADPTRTTWLFRKFDRMCGETSRTLTAEASSVFPESCRVARLYGRPTESFPGVLFAAAVRADLESMPSKLGGPEAARVDPVLLALMQRVRDGDPTLGLLAALPRALERPADGLESAIVLAGRLISYLGDVLAVQNLAELERALPILSAQLVRYWPSLQATPVVAFKRESVSRVAREVYLLNQLALTNGEGRDRDATELGFRYLSAMLRTLDVAVLAAIEAAALGHGTTQSWKRSLAAAQAGALMVTGRYPEGALALTRPEVAGATGETQVTGSVNTILPLAVSVATQQTPTGVASALDAGAQRVTIGDLRAERVQFSFSGQFGLGITLDSPSDGDTGPGTAFVVGLTLPVGVGLSIPVCGTYLSAQLSMLDVAQLAALPYSPTPGSARRNGQEVDVVAVPTTTIRPEQFLAPGFSVGFALPKTAILLALSGSLAPRLREYEFRDDDERVLDSEQRTVLRVGAKMVVDLPILEFF